MSGLGDRLEVDILGQLHVLRVDTEDLHSADLIGHANIDFSVETTSTSQGWVDRVWTVCGADDHNLAAALGTVHECEKLSNDTFFNFTLTLLSVGSDRVNLINEDD